MPVLICLALLISATARASAIPIGVLSIDVLTPPANGVPGVNVFNISDLTGAFNLPPDFPPSSFRRPGCVQKHFQRKHAMTRSNFWLTFALGATPIVHPLLAQGPLLGFVTKLGIDVDVGSGSRILADEFSNTVVLPDLAGSVSGGSVVPQIQFREENGSLNYPWRLCSQDGKSLAKNSARVRTIDEQRVPHLVSVPQGKEWTAPNPGEVPYRLSA